MAAFNFALACLVSGPVLLLLLPPAVEATAPPPPEKEDIWEFVESLIKHKANWVESTDLTVTHKSGPPLASTCVGRSNTNTKMIKPKKLDFLRVNTFKATRMLYDLYDNMICADTAPKKDKVKDNWLWHILTSFSMQKTLDFFREYDDPAANPNYDDPCKFYDDFKNQWLAETGGISNFQTVFAGKYGKTPWVPKRMTWFRYYLLQQDGRLTENHGSAVQSSANAISDFPMVDASPKFTIKYDVAAKKECHSFLLGAVPELEIAIQTVCKKWIVGDCWILRKKINNDNDGWCWKINTYALTGKVESGKKDCV